jgi:hypothetical protein
MAARLADDIAVQRLTHEGAQRPSRPSVGNGGLAVGCECADAPI